MIFSYYVTSNSERDAKSFDPPLEGSAHLHFPVKFSLQMDGLSLSYESFFVYLWN